MAMVVLQIDPAGLANPDSDLRYALADLLVERAEGLLTDDGYDYAGDGAAPCVLLYFQTRDVARAVAVVVAVLEGERVLENDLSRVAVGVLDAGEFRVVYPERFSGAFWRGEGT